jgi:hypothetical protein
MTRRDRRKFMQVSQGIMPERLGELESKSDESSDPEDDSDANAPIVHGPEETCKRKN